MTQTTETEIRELRDLIIGSREEMRVGFAQLRGEIQTVAANTDTKISELKGEIQAIAANTDIKLANVDTKISELKGDMDTKFAEIRGDIKVIEERTKLGFWGFVWRAVVIAVLVSLISVANKFVLGGGLGSLGM